VDVHTHEMAGRLMNAYVALGCQRTWTCAPYQAGHRPRLGEHVAWGESNAVVFCNSVLGARTERYGDFLDICCAIVGRAPAHGLHLDENRLPVAAVDLKHLSRTMVGNDAFYPVLGTWLGREFVDRVVVFDGLPTSIDEDQLKALGAAAASSGAIGLFHVLGRTPEIHGMEALLRANPVPMVFRPSASDLLAATPGTVVVPGQRIDAVALGSPHFSPVEMRKLLGLAAGRKFVVPFYVCTGRHTIEAMEQNFLQVLKDINVILVVDTCIVVTPILPSGGGLLMTNSGKFAHYAKPLIGYDVIYGSLAECVESAVVGKLVRSEFLWG
jgi:predicted aconitase